MFCFYVIFRFYYECLLPELINPQYGKRLLKSDIKDPPFIKQAQNEAEREREMKKEKPKRK